MVTAEQLNIALRAEGFPADGIFLPDAEYSLPDETFITASLATRYQFFQRQKAGMLGADLATYQPERNDCDDFALHCVSLAKLDHALNSKRETGLAVGEAWFYTATQAHAVVIAAHANAATGQIYLRYYEPQETPQNRFGNPFFPLAPFNSARIERRVFVRL